MVYGYFRAHDRERRLALSFETNCDVCIITKKEIWRFLQADDTLVIEDVFQLVRSVNELPALLLRLYHSRIDLQCLQQPWLNVKQTTPVYLMNDIITGMNRLHGYQKQPQRHYRLRKRVRVRKPRLPRNFHYDFQLQRINRHQNPYAILPPILAESEMTICLDESGNLGFDQTRYFVLGGFVTNRLHTAIQRYGKLEMQEKRHNRRARHQELKSTQLSQKTRLYFMESLLQDELLTPVCLIVDKKMPTYNVGKKREYYNFLVKTLIQKLCECGLILPHSRINLRIDQQSLPLESINSLVEYINAELRYDEKERCALQEITVDYLDSAKNTDIRIADFIVGVVRVNCEHEHREIESKRLNARLLHYHL